MGGSGYSLVLKEASLIDIEEIRAEVPAGDFTVLQPSEDAESHNELATVLVLSLTSLALSAMSMWLLRTRTGEVIDYKFTIRSPEGSETDVQIKIRRSSSEAPKAQVIKQIAAALKIPEASIIAASP
jgi:hypothetical protein